MRKQILMMVMVMMSSSAFAQTQVAKYICTDAQNTQAKYTVYLGLVYPAGSAGSLASLQIPGETKLRKMKCFMPVSAPPMGADQLYPVAICDDGVRDGGFSIQVSAGGLAGRTIATVLAKDFVQNHVIAQTGCRLMK